MSWVSISTKRGSVGERTDARIDAPRRFFFFCVERWSIDTPHSLFSSRLRLTHAPTQHTLHAMLRTVASRAAPALRASVLRAGAPRAFGIESQLSDKERAEEVRERRGLCDVCVCTCVCV